MDVYAPVTLASADQEAVSDITPSSAVVSGEVDPEGVAVSGCEFEYELETGGYAKAQSCSPTPGSGSTYEKVSASLSGLAEGTQYGEGRLSVTNANGVSYAQQLRSFETPFRFEVTSAGAGAGTVQCEVFSATEPDDFKAPEPCATEYYKTIGRVRVTAVPGAGLTFEGWTVLEGPTTCNGTTEPCVVRYGHNPTEFEGPTKLVANFSGSGTKYPLTVHKTGAGTGTVESSPPGIDCEPAESECSHEYEAGQRVELKEAPVADAEFVKWEGCDSESGAGKEVCVVTMTAARSVTAEFKPSATKYVPLVTTEPASGVEVVQEAGHGVVRAALNGKVAPGGLPVTSCVFEYGTSTAYGQTVPCVPAAKDIPTTGEPEPAVTASVSGLLPGTTYHFRLRAANANGEAPPAADQSFLTPGPGIGEASVSDVSDVSATLNATVDPDGASTSWHFEYDTREYAEGEGPHGTSVPAGEGAAGSGSEQVAVGEALQGLAASTEYFYRLVAVSQLDVDGVTQAVVFDGPQQTFTTQTASTQFVLPDGRGYEMVSPPQKQGALITADTTSEQGWLFEAASAGGAFAYTSTTPTESGVTGYAETTQVLSTRTAQGWHNRDLSIPHERATLIPFTEGPEYRRFSSDLSAAVVQPYGTFTPCVSARGAPQPCISPAASEQTPFLEDLQAGSFSPLVTGCPQAGEPCPPAVEERADVPPGTVFGGHQLEFAGTPCPENDKYCGPLFVAATPDLSHVVLLSATPLTEGEGAGGGLYEYSAGRLTFIGKGENDGKEGHFEGADAAHMAHGISTDGSRVIFNGKGENPNHEPVQGLLMRDTASEETVLLGEHGEFQTASASQSRVFFSEAGDLKICEVVGGAGGHLQCELTDLTTGAGLLGDVLGASEDGSYVYFVSPGVLGDGAQHGARPGEDNLYVNHYEAGVWTPSFIASLPPADSDDWHYQVLEEQPTGVSPNGQWLAFDSQAQLAGYRSAGHTEVYLYHPAAAANAATLTCASCKPTGEDATGAAHIPTWEGNKSYTDLQPYQPRYLSDQGRLFFDSSEALVPLDGDGTEDVYEYEPEGVGSCTSSSSSSSSGSVVFEPARAFALDGHSGESAAGCVALISSGDSGEPSTFLDATEDGSEVFFLTSAHLASQDTDSAPDVYVARECTSGAPCLSAPVSPPACDNESSCRPSPTPQPSIYGPSASETFTGPGNPAPSLPSSPPTTKPKPETPQQKLAKALRSCRGKKVRKKRIACEKQARHTYAVKAADTSPHRRGTKR